MAASTRTAAVLMQGGATDHTGAASLASTAAVTTAGQRGYFRPDHFPGASFDAWWTGGTGWTVSGGRAVGVPSAAGSYNYPAVNLVNLVGRNVRWETATFPAVADDSAGCYVSLYIDADNWVSIGTYSDTNIRARKRVASVTTDVWTATLDTTAHRWARIREASGTTYWETSADGENWTTRASEANPITLTSLGMEAGSVSSGATVDSNWEIESFAVTQYAGSAARASTATVAAAGAPEKVAAAALASTASVVAAGQREATAAAALAANAARSFQGLRETFGTSALALTATRTAVGQRGYIAKDHFATISDYWVDPYALGFFTASGGRAIGPPTQDGTYMDARYHFNLVGKTVKWETAVFPDATDGQAYFYVGMTHPTILAFVNWELDGATQEVRVYSRADGEGTQTLYSAALDPVAHRWLRIRESGGTTYWDSSADGENWTNRASDANPFALTEVNLSFGTGCASGTPVDDWEIESFGIDQYAGSAARASSVSAAALGQRDATGTAALAMTDSRAAAGQRDTFSASALAMTNTLAAAGLVTRLGASALAMTAERTALGQRDAVSAALLALTADRTASSIRDTFGASALAMTAPVTASGFLSQFGSASLVLSSARAAAGQREVVSSSSLAFSLAAQATGQADFFAAAALASTAGASAVGVREQLAAAALGLTSVRTATGYILVVGASSLALSQAAAAAGLRTATGSAFAALNASRSATGFADRYGAAALALTFLGVADTRIAEDHFARARLRSYYGWQVNSDVGEQVFGKAWLFTNVSVAAKPWAHFFARAALASTYRYSPQGEVTRLGAASLVLNSARAASGLPLKASSASLSMSAAWSAPDGVVSLDFWDGVGFWDDGYDVRRFGLAQAGAPGGVPQLDLTADRTGLAQVGADPPATPNSPWNVGGFKDGSSK